MPQKKGPQENRGGVPLHLMDLIKNLKAILVEHDLFQ